MRFVDCHSVMWPNERYERRMTGQGSRNDAGFEYVREKFGDIACECLLRGHGHGIVMAFTYYPDINEYQGVRTPQIVIQNYK